MLPKSKNVERIASNIEILTQPSKTYKIDGNRIKGFIDSVDAIKQSIMLRLSTQRYDNIIYSWNYGFEKNNLLGKRKEYIIPQLENRIREALLVDDRIMTVYDFKFDIDAGKYKVTFKLKTIEGEIEVMTDV